MKKIIVLGIIVILMVSMVISSADISEELKAVVAPFKIIVDEEEKAFEMPIIVINGRTYLPLRETAETLGIGVDWIGEEKTVVISTKNEEIDFPYEVNFTVIIWEKFEFTFYNIGIKSESGNVKMKVDYNDKDYDYLSEPGFPPEDVRDIKYKYSEEKRMTLDQCKQIINLISKEETYEQKGESGLLLYMLPPNYEGGKIFVKDTRTDKIKEVSFDEKIYQNESLKELVEMIVELSPIEIVNKEGKLPAFMAE